MKLHSQKYLSYINSFDWYLKRRAALERAGQQCEYKETSRAQRCPNTEGLEVHHLTYDRLGNEKNEDLQVLCPACHKIADQKRAAETAYQQYWARVDGWASKKYGDDWGDYMDADEVSDEFDEWLENKEEY